MKMKVEIWSDIMCPFCYIGKRKFEDALEQFENKNNIEIVWKSFQLNPSMETNQGKNINQYLAEIKGWSLEQAKEMNKQVTGMAANVGLTYDFDKAVVANSFNAHQLIQLAKTQNKGNEAEERLFKAYLSEGKNTDDYQTLVELATEIGIDSKSIEETLTNNTFAEQVHADVQEAQQLGIRGVPFFVIDRKYGVSGAQESATFLDALTKAWQEKAATAAVM